MQLRKSMVNLSQGTRRRAGSRFPSVGDVGRRLVSANVCQAAELPGSPHQLTWSQISQLGIWSGWRNNDQNALFLFWLLATGLVCHWLVGRFGRRGLLGWFRSLGSLKGLYSQQDGDSGSEGVLLWCEAFAAVWVYGAVTEGRPPPPPPTQPHPQSEICQFMSLCSTLTSVMFAVGGKNMWILGQFHLRVFYKHACACTLVRLCMRTYTHTYTHLITVTHEILLKWSDVLIQNRSLEC